MKNILKISLLSLAVSFFFSSCQTKEIEQVEALEVKKELTVAVFSGNGASATCILESLEALKIDSGIAGFALSAAEIQNGKLDEFDAIIFPGGSGSKELLNLGKVGRQKVHEFINEKGGGVIGICAGGYLLSKTPTYPSLELADVMNIDRAHYARGRGLVEFTLEEAGNEYFPELKDQKMFLQYYDGPILEATDSLANYKEIATYVSDIHANKGIPTGVTPGTGFMIEQNIGKGKLFIVAGHPESTPGMRWIVPRMARIVTGKELISYNKQWVRPELNTKEIMFDSELKKVEKANSWQLFNDTASIQLEAMASLYAMRSRPAVRWNLGLLRSESSEVRAEAARLLAETEYTWAIPDLEAALANEKDEKVKAQLQKSLDFLKN